MLNQGVQMASHKNKKPRSVGGQGTWGAPSTSASNLSKFCRILEMCFTKCFTSGLTDGVALRLTDGEPPGLPLG